MRVSNTSERLKLYMEENNLKQTDILNKVKPYCDKYNEKINKSHLSQWVSGRNEPNAKKLYILSKALCVPEIWLMGYEVSESYKQGEADALLLKKIHQLTPRDRKVVEAMIDNFLA